MVKNTIMVYTKWKQEFSTNIESIDNQHKKLFDLLNEFYENISKKSNNDLIGAVLREMKEYTANHFAYEERLFDEYAYPDAVQHKKEHDSFVAKVVDLENRFMGGTVILTFEVTDFLKKWVRDHIMGTDMKYRDFLISNGVK